MRKVYTRCPLCGMRTPVDRLNKPYAVEAWIHEFGGKVKGMGKGKGMGRGSAPGLMRYTPTSADPYKALLVASLQKAADALGYRVVKK